MKRRRRLVLIPVAVIFVITLAVILTFDFAGKPAPSGTATETTSASTSVSGSTAAETTETTVTTTETETGIGELEGGTVTAELSSDGSAYYAVTFDSGETAGQKAGTDMIFTSREDPDAFLEFRYISGKLPENLEPSYADEYLDYQDIEFAGLENVGNTDILGRHIIAANGEQKLECYLIPVGGDAGTLAAAILTGSGTGEKAAGALYAILDSLAVGE